MSYLIGNVVIPAPSYIPEIKGIEDVTTILKYVHLIPTGNPILVPSNRWIEDIKTPVFKNGNVVEGIIPITTFLGSHPIIFYDPPELFRYKYTTELVKYALKGNAMESKKFNDLLSKGDKDSALGLIHPFFHPFIEKQLATICKKKEYSTVLCDDPDKRSHVVDAWDDERVDSTYIPYIFEVINDAIKMPSATIIPPVPPLMVSSSNKTVETVLRINKTVSTICQSIFQDRSLLEVSNTYNILPYFHLYLDWNIVTASKKDDVDINKIINTLREGLNNGQFSGVAITLNGYENAAKAGKMDKIEFLINEIANISHERYLPVILPRSGLYGLYLTDSSIQAFSSLFNGNHVYSKSGGGLSEEDRFGKTYLIEECRELKFSEVRNHVSEYDEFPSSINGMPKKPIGFTSDKNYRINWSKPRRLSHIEEARRMRKANEDGVINPAKRYFERSKHPLLSNL